jgi:hypothetical protein
VDEHVDRLALVRLPFQFLGGLVLFVIEELDGAYGVLTRRDEKWLQFQAEQRARLRSDYYD